MKTPFKIIHKHLNNNDKIQYSIYIFIGNTPNRIIEILNKIKNFDLFKTLVSVLSSKEEKEMMINEYGENWYIYFFNGHHIKKTIKRLNQPENEFQKKKIIDLSSIEWFDKHFNLNIIKKQNIRYGYEYFRNKKNAELIKNKGLIEMKKNYESNNIMSGGNNDVDIDDIDDDIDNDIVDSDDENEMEENDFDLINDDLENKNYENDINFEIDENKILENSKLIENIIKTEKNKDYKNIIEFDNEKIKNTSNDNLEDVIDKNYVYNQFIYIDDTIQNIKNKICISFKNNNIYTNKKAGYIIPDYQYLWGEYMVNDKINKIMIGHELILKHLLLNIDVEPLDNSINYINYETNAYKDLYKLLKNENSITIVNNNTNILEYYKNYISYNELYLVDIYNSINIDYNLTDDEFSKLYYIFVKLYFPNISKHNFQNILKLKSKNYENVNDEIVKQTNIYKTLLNDLIIENEIISIIEQAKPTKFYCDVYITRIAYKFELEMKKGKLDFFKIFDNFELNDENMPLIQYKTNSYDINIKYNDKFITNNQTTIKKMLENNYENYKLIFYINMKTGYNEYIEDASEQHKYIIVILYPNGMLNYSIQWKENDKIKMEDIDIYHIYIKQLIEKINGENEKYGNVIEIPENKDFNISFLNSIQKIIIPKNSQINHNDLTNFTRNFYPYISVIVEPKKRNSKLMNQSNNNTGGKYGSYFRYNRVNKYNDVNKIFQKIMFFYKNYFFKKEELIDKLTELFNITNESSELLVDEFNAKFKNIKKSKRNLELLSKLKKQKMQGIYIEIQGKDREQNKIKITGATNMEQLNRITHFLKSLLHIYFETYLFKNNKYSFLIDKLKFLTNIAKRKNKIIDYIKNEDDSKQKNKNTKLETIQKKTLNDVVWSRMCQNSGKIKRRPLQFKNITHEEIIKKGYVLNKKYGFYEKKVSLNKNNKNLTTIKMVKLEHNDNENNYTYLACTPEENGEYVHIGFQDKDGYECVPCCYKKDRLYSDNDAIKKNYLKCINKLDLKNDDTTNENNILYILQKTKSIYNKRYMFLDNDFEIIFNKYNNNNYVIKNNQLFKTDNYFFKYNLVTDSNNLLYALSNAIDIDIKDIVNKLIMTLNNSDITLFTSLNKGGIRYSYKTVENFINYLKNNEIEYEHIKDLITMPNCLTKNGLNLIIFEKHNNTYKINDNDNIFDSSKDILLLIKDDYYYHIIVKIIKKNQDNKQYKVEKIFKSNEYFVKLINDYILTVKQNNKLNIEIYSNLIFAFDAKTIYNKITNVKNFKIKYQVLDSIYKCIFLITENNILIPTYPSGCIYNVKIINNIDKYLFDYQTTIKNINSLKEVIDINIIGLKCGKINDELINVVALILDYNFIIPIISTKIKLSSIKQNEIFIDYDTIEFEIDKNIEKYNNYDDIIDESLIAINNNNYKNEMYQLFKFHLSDFLNYGKNNKLKETILNVINKPDNEMNESTKRNNLKKILYYVLNKDLYKIYNDLLTDKHIKTTTELKIKETFIKIIPEDKFNNIEKYNFSNYRKICESLNQDECSQNIHYVWSANNNKCMMGIKNTMLIENINKVVEEFLFNELSRKEILQIDNYTVSDIINNNYFKEKENEVIISNKNKKLINNLNLELNIDNLNIFNVEYKKKLILKEYESLKTLNPIVAFKNYYIQSVYNVNQLYRAFVNGFYWTKNNNALIEERNLGFIDTLQNQLVDFVKGNVINWALENLKKDAYFFVDTITLNTKIQNTYKLEFEILSKIFKVNIKLYDELINVIEKIGEDYEIDIHILLKFLKNNNVPNKMETIYFVNK